MLKLLIGLILILIPFLLVNRFSNKKLGFFCVFSGMIGFILVASVFTQLFHIFTYNVLLAIFIIVSVLIVAYSYKKDNVKKIKIDWILLLVIAVLFFQLYSVHFNYSGKISTINGYDDVKNAKFVYPYYSDEWVGVSLIKYSISSKSLPFANPLFEGKVFYNLEFGFHSFLSGIFLLFGFDALNDYTKISLFFGMLICILSYLLLRENNISRLNSAIASISIPFIVNGVNLPGIWYLMPFTIGMACLLLGFIFISINSRKMSILISFLILLFYPPLFVFYTFSLIFYFNFSDFSKKDKIKYLGIYLGICSLVAVFLSVYVFIMKDYSIVKTLDFILSKIFFSTLTENAIPDYSIWKVIPIPLLLIGLFGLIIAFRKKMWLSSVVIVGFIYWSLYSQYLWRFIIEYQRDVVVTSILIVIFCGFGLEYLLEKLVKYNYVKKYRLDLCLQIAIILIILFFSFNYTKINNWEELKLRDLKTDKLLSPAAPATNYFVEDDLNLFREINKSRFLSVPWKGLVIGTATGNYPLDTKPSTITVKKLPYSDFISGDCSKKNELALVNKIKYIYSTEFKCDNFVFIGKSSENFYLYEFK